MCLKSFFSVLNAKKNEAGKKGMLYFVLYVGCSVEFSYSFYFFGVFCSCLDRKVSAPVQDSATKKKKTE